MKGFIFRVKLCYSIVLASKKKVDVIGRVADCKHFIIHTCDERLQVTTDIEAPEIMMDNFLPKQLHSRYSKEKISEDVKSFRHTTNKNKYN